jgi:hypothetical protein
LTFISSRSPYAPEYLLHLLRLENLALHAFFERLPYYFHPALDELVLDIDKHDLQAFLGRLLRDTAAHVTCADNTHLLKLGHLSLHDMIFVVLFEPANIPFTCRLHQAKTLYRFLLRKSERCNAVFRSYN